MVKDKALQLKSISAALLEAPSLPSKAATDPDLNNANY